MKLGNVISSAKVVASLFAVTLLQQAAPAGAATVTSGKAACKVAKAVVAARDHFPVSEIAFCDPLIPAEQPKGLYVLGLHGKRDDCGGDVCSTLMGWFAVQKATGRVFEWDFTDFPGKLGKPVRVHH